MEKIRIGVCHPRLEGKGGAERWVLRVAQHYNAPVYCTSYDGEKTFAEFRGMQVSVIKNPLEPLFFWMPKKIRENVSFVLSFMLFKKPPEVDVLLCCTPPAEFISFRNKGAIWYCQSPGRIAYDAYGTKVGALPLCLKAAYAAAIGIFRPLDKIAIGRLGKLFANSKNVQQRLQKYLCVESEVLYQGVLQKGFECKKYGKFFFYPSRITPYKRFEIAIGAYKKFRQENPKNGFSFVIAGFLNERSGEDLKYFERLKGLLGEEGKIIANPDDATLMGLFADCYCFLYTPKEEDFGLIPVEAAACQKATIGINEGGLKETIVDGETGFLVEDEAQMAARMGEIAKDKKLAALMGKSAHRRYLEKFTWGKYFERLDGAINEVFKGKGANK